LSGKSNPSSNSPCDPFAFDIRGHSADQNAVTSSSSSSRSVSKNLSEQRLAQSVTHNAVAQVFTVPLLGTKNILSTSASTDENTLRRQGVSRKQSFSSVRSDRSRSPTRPIINSSEMGSGNAGSGFTEKSTNQWGRNSPNSPDTSLLPPMKLFASRSQGMLTQKGLSELLTVAVPGGKVDTSIAIPQLRSDLLAVSSQVYVNFGFFLKLRFFNFFF